MTPPTAFRRAASRAALLVFALGGLGPAACESPDAPAEKDPLGDVAFVPWYGSPGGGYFLGLTEVSNGAFDAFLRSTRYRRDDPAFLHHWSTGDGGVKTLPPSLANHPVVHVNGLDARAYARWKGMRLPTSREWDWAAGYGVNGGFPFGLWRPLRANTLELGLDHTTPVGLFENGRSLLGFYDLSGNVSELTLSEGGCVLKGGSYLQWLQRVEFSTVDIAVSEESSAQDAGFRCAADALPLLEERILRGPATSGAKIRSLTSLLRQGGPPARSLLEEFAERHAGARPWVASAVSAAAR